MSDRLLHTTTSLCRVCKNAVAADVVATAGGEVWMRKRCDQHGAQEVRLSTDARWYEDTRAIALGYPAGPTEGKPRKPIDRVLTWFDEPTTDEEKLHG